MYIQVFKSSLRIIIDKIELKICLYYLGKIMLEGNESSKKTISQSIKKLIKKDQKTVFGFLIKWGKIDNENIRKFIKDCIKELSSKEQEKLKSYIKIERG